MIQNTHWKQLARNWASILFGNALYSLAVALFLEPAGLITGGATGIALAIGRLTGLMIDGWAGLLVALFILWSGVGVVKDTVDPLLGAKPDEALVRAIAYLMTSHVDILGFHDLMVHDLSLIHI